MDDNNHLWDVEKWKSKRRQKKGIVSDDNPVLTEATLSSLSAVNPVEDNVTKLELTPTLKEETVVTDENAKIQSQTKTTSKIAPKKDRGKFEIEKKSITLRKSPDFKTFGFDVEQCRKTSKILITNILPESPAEISGLLLNDELIEINELEVKDMQLKNITRLIKDRYKLGHISLKLISTAPTDSISQTSQISAAAQQFEADKSCKQNDANVSKHVLTKVDNAKLKKSYHKSTDIGHVDNVPRIMTDKGDNITKQNFTKKKEINKNPVDNVVKKIPESEEKNVSGDRIHDFKQCSEEQAVDDIDLDKLTISETIQSPGKNTKTSLKTSDTTDKTFVNKQVEECQHTKFKENVNVPEIKSLLGDERPVKDKIKATKKVEGQSKVSSLRNAFEDHSLPKDDKMIDIKRARSNQNIWNPASAKLSYEQQPMALGNASLQTSEPILQTLSNQPIHTEAKEQYPLLKSELSFNLSEIQEPKQPTSIKSERNRGTGQIGKSIAIKRLDEDRYKTPIVNINPGIDPSPVEYYKRPEERPQLRSQEVSSDELCVACGKPLGSGTAIRIESIHIYYHMYCFKCSECNRLMEMTNDGMDVEVRSNYKLCCDRCSLVYKGFKGRYL